MHITMMIMMINLANAYHVISASTHKTKCKHKSQQITTVQHFTTFRPQECRDSQYITV